LSLSLGDMWVDTDMDPIQAQHFVIDGMDAYCPAYSPGRIGD